MLTPTEILFNFILEDTNMHMATLMELPSEKRQAVVGRKGKIIVPGPQGGTFIVRLTPVGILPEAGEDDIRNEVLIDYAALREIIIWIAQLDLPPELKDPMWSGTDPRSAYTNGDIRFVTGDSVLYDAEEIFRALEKHVFLKMKPIAKYLVEVMKKAAKSE